LLSIILTPQRLTSTFFPYTTLFRSRDLEGTENYDKVVSVGMFEHVGHANLGAYFKVLHDQVKPGGLVMNHGITAKYIDGRQVGRDRKSTRLNSSHVKISYAVFCLKK